MRPIANRSGFKPRFPIWLGSIQRKDIGAWRSPGVKQFTLNFNPDIPDESNVW
jgi:hypothetical protein